MLQGSPNKKNNNNKKNWPIENEILIEKSKDRDV